MLKIILRKPGDNLHDELYSMATENSIIVETELTFQEFVDRCEQNNCKLKAFTHPKNLHLLLEDEKYEDVDQIIISLFNDEVIKYINLQCIYDKNIIIGAIANSDGSIPKKLLDYISSNNYILLKHDSGYANIAEKINLGGKENGKR